MAFTQNEFITIKTLQEAGSSNLEIAQFLRTTPQKTSIAYKSETYEDYKNACYLVSKKAIAARKAKETAKQEPEEPKAQEQPTQVIEHRQTIQLQATHYMTQELREMKELLKTISAKMALIVDDLYGNGKATADAGTSNSGRELNT